jgi:Domain of unknown function (DUF4124)
VSVWPIVTWLSILWVGFAGGQIYKWMDRQGNTHFTDNPSRIPLEYRSKVEVERASPPAPLPAPGDDAAKVPSTETAPSDAPTVPPPKDRLGRGPDYWQQLAQYWSDQLQQQSQERDRLQQQHDFTRAQAHSTRDASARGRLEAEIVRLEKAVAEANAAITKAQTMLQTTLPQEARRLGANPEWLRPPVTIQR